MKRILVLHRNGLFRDCLANYLEATGNFQASAEPHESAQHGGDLVAAGTDIILLDLNLPCNLAKQIVNAVQTTSSHTKVVLLVPDDHQALFECMAAGVHACVLERSPLQELILAIESVAAGETICSNDFAKLMFSEVARLGQRFTWQIPQTSSPSRLTSREQQILELIAERMGNKEIAKKLSVSLHTVKNHVHNILEKLQVENRQEAVEAMRQENFLS